MWQTIIFDMTGFGLSNMVSWSAIQGYVHGELTITRNMPR